jgi:hypothetical protein
MLVLAGCETEPSSQATISINPRNVSIRPGQSQEFSASGWHDYTWSLSDPSRGTLSTTTGIRTVFTATANQAATNLTGAQVLTLSVQGSTTANSSNTVGNLPSAEAIITIVYEETGPVVTPLSIAPPVATIAKGESIALKAEGFENRTDLVWKLEDTEYGKLSSTEGRQTVFTATEGPLEAGDLPFPQTISLSSKDGRNKTTAVVSITRPK